MIAQHEPEITRQEFERFLRPTTSFRGSEHAIRCIVSADASFVEYETFCDETVLDTRHALLALRLSFPWDGESYSGCTACLDGVASAPALPLPYLYNRRRRLEGRWLWALRCA